MSEVVVQGYRLAVDRAYHPDTHVWVEEVGPGRVRLGLDPLGVETTGTIAQLAMAAPGSVVRAGQPVGTLEAEKFVGPLSSPVAGTVVAVNDAAVADPRLVHAEPLRTWLVELEVEAAGAAGDGLVRGDDVVPWFERKVAEYRIKGVLAE